MKRKHTNSHLISLVEASYGQDTEEILEQMLYDGIDCGVCDNCEDVIDYIEPDNDKGYCDCCGEASVISLSMLLGII